MALQVPIWIPVAFKRPIHPNCSSTAAAPSSHLLVLQNGGLALDEDALAEVRRGQCVFDIVELRLDAHGLVPHIGTAGAGSHGFACTAH